MKKTRKTQSWKHNAKGRNVKQYGNRYSIKRLSPFMTLDETYLGREIQSIKG